MQSADLAAVRAVVETLDTFPADARQVFLEGLPGSVAGTGGILLAAALQDANAAASKASEEASAAAEEAANELDMVKTALEEVSSSVETTQAEAEKTESISKAAAKVAKEAEREHNFSEKAAASQTKEWAAVREEQARAAAVLGGSFRLLEAGGWEDEEVKVASVQAVEDFLNDINAEKVLIAALPIAISAKPDSRKPFDAMAVEAAGKVLASHLAGLEAKVRESEPEEKEAKAELLGLWALAEVAREKAQETKDAALIASAELSTAESRLTLSRKRLQEVEATSTDSAAKKARCESRLVELRAGEEAVGRLKAAPAQEDIAEPVEGAAEAASSVA